MHFIFVGIYMCAFVCVCVYSESDLSSHFWWSNGSSSTSLNHFYKSDLKEIVPFAYRVWSF